MAGLALLGLGLLLTTAAAAAADQAADPAADLLRLAAAADRDRETLRELRDDWQAEAARLTVVLEALEDEHQRLVEQRDRILARRQAITATTASLREDAAGLAALDEAVTALAETIASTVATGSANSALQIHQAGITDTAPSATSPTERLSAALTALAEAETQARRIVRRTLSGVLADGSRQAAEVLAIGGAAAWWLAPDGRAGTVRVVDGIRHFEAVDPAAAAAIRQAFAIQRGDQPASVTVLPLQGDNRMQP